MATPLNVLVVEDRPTDAELMVIELRREGFAPRWQRVETEAEYCAALSSRPDVILADFTLPQFDARRALEILQERGLDVPLIVVTGSIGEEVAVECMQLGAADYLLKDRLARLGQAVRRALSEQQLRRQNRRAEDQVRALNADLERRVAERTAQLEAAIEELQLAVRRREEAEAQLSAVKDELAARLADMTRLYELSVRMSARIDLQSVLQDVLAAVIELQRADMGLLMLVEADSQTPHTVASLGFGEAYLRIGQAQALGEAVCQMAMAVKRSVIVEEIETDDRYARFAEVARVGGFRAMHGTPLITFGGDVIGTIVTHFRERRRPSARETQLVELFARQAAGWVERARLYRAAEEAIRARDQVLAVVTHDLKNPLTTIKGWAQLIRLNSRQDGTVDPEKLGPALRNIEEATRRATVLISDLLDVTRMQSGRLLDLELNETDLVALVRTAVADQQQTTDRHEIRFETDVPRLIGRWDASRLERVFANLVSNSLKYSPDGGVVTVTISTIATNGDSQGGQGGRWGIVTIRDEGIGIPARDLPHIFDQFRRAGNVGEIPGTGIGLASVRQIVEQHGGTIRAESEEGVGSTFTVLLPLTAIRETSDEQTTTD